MFFAFFRTAALLLILLGGTGFVPEASAQTAAPGVVSQQQAVISSLSDKVNDLEGRIAANANDDAKLVDIRLQLETIGREILTSAQAFRPRLSEINTRLEQLGPAPANDQAQEPEIVQQERARLTSEKAEINAVLGIAENLSIRINGLVTRIAEMRRELFARLLTKRYAITPDLAKEVVSAFGEASSDLYRTTSSWLRFVVQFKLNSVLAATFLALLVAAILLIGGRRVFGRMFETSSLDKAPSYLSRLSVAFWSTLMPTVALAAFLSTMFLLYDYFGVLRGDIGKMMTALLIVIGLIFFVTRLATAVLSPRHPEWRLIGVETRAARILLWLVSATAFFTGVDFFLSTVYQVLGSPLSLTVGESLVTTVLTGIPIILIGLVKPFSDEQGVAKPWHPLLRFALFFLGGLTIVAALLGYIGFARFLSAQIVITGAVLATMYIGFLSARAISDEGAFAHTTVGMRLARRFSLDETTLDQVGLVVSVAINLLIVIVGLPLILFLWGFQPGDITAWIYRFATEIRIGSVSFSLTGVLTGVVVFIFGYFVTRWFQGWLDDSVMARGRVDPGVRNSIRTVVGYVGLALAALVGISAAGINLSNLALIAGGLSLGIGFGLQNVVSNFVSGLILLAERPFKAGDWIVAGAVSGTVKKISVRATEIETFQRQTVILPNSELINAAVANWTHKNKLGRIEIPIGVAYGSDAKRVHALLLEIARNHPLVLKTPEPFVLFSAFADSSLNFEVRVFLGDITNSVIVQNDIRFAILETFEREGIEIPFPQRDVNIKAAAAPVAPPPGRKAAKPAGGRAKRLAKPDPDQA